MIVFAHGACYGCGRIFSFNPMRVPSIRVDGVRRPICAGCGARCNPERIKNGVPPIEVLPGAYEACDASEID